MGYRQSIYNFIFISIGWSNCNNEKKTFEANDIKCRYLKPNDYISLIKIIYGADSLYNQDKDSFIRRVFQAEQQIAQQENIIWLIVEKERIKDYDQKSPFQ